MLGGNLVILFIFWGGTMGILKRINLQPESFHLVRIPVEFSSNIQFDIDVQKGPGVDIILVKSDYVTIEKGEILELDITNTIWYKEEYLIFRSSYRAEGNQILYLVISNNSDYEQSAEYEYRGPAGMIVAREQNVESLELCIETPKRDSKTYIDPNGYRRYSDSDRLVHIHIAEIYVVRRKLREDEVVHHINWNKLDNRAANLRVMTWREHRELHDR